MANASDERAAPSAIGTLGARPLLHLLVYARNRRLSGRLELHAADGRSGSIDLWRGCIRAALTTPAVAYFGAVAYELGHIDTATLDATLLEIANTKRLHGEVLVERGALTPALRNLVLAEQTCRKVHHLFSLPDEATFAFYEERTSAEEPAFTLDPIRPAWRGLCDRPPTESVRDVLARYASATLRLANEGPVARAGLGPDEIALCEALTWKPMTLAQLRATSPLPRARLDLLVYLLVIAKCAEPVTASSSELPASPPARASSGSMPAAAPARASSGSMPAARTSRPSMPAMSSGGSGEMRRSLSFRVPSTPSIRAADDARTSIPSVAVPYPPVLSPEDLGATGIEHRASGLANEDLFTALGVAQGASVEAVRAAYFRLAKVWHPDRLPPDLAPFRIEAEAIFAHMAHAHRTLTDPDARRDYLAGVPERTPLEKRSRAELLRDIELALAKREFHAAEATAQSLADADADDADALALVAWASTFAGEASEETLRAALPLLDRAVNRDCDCERALYYRGVLHKRLGSSAQAFRDFTRVVTLEPKHVDAQRELRIFEMRARKGSGEHALGALLGKTKKR